MAIVNSLLKNLVVCFSVKWLSLMQKLPGLLFEELGVAMTFNFARRALSSLIL